MTLARINPLQAWPDAGPALEKALPHTCHSHLDLRRACLRGEAYLLATDRMFLVVRPEKTVDGFELLVWAAAAKDGATDSVVDVLPDLEAMARGMGANGVVFVTDKKGMERIVGPAWHRRCFVMERRF